MKGVYEVIQNVIQTRAGVGGGAGGEGKAGGEFGASEPLIRYA